MGRIHKSYYSANARCLSEETIQEIKESVGKIPDAINAMVQKYRIGYYRVLDYIDNKEHKQQIIHSVASSEVMSENNTSDRRSKKRKSGSSPRSVRIFDSVNICPGTSSAIINKADITIPAAQIQNPNAEIPNPKY
ncbi:hypothetical protein Glove_421g103 [Diversispora epigaea]|uniref:Uncharacterized protein n=1 Tax=Diversispora epigaea TaxID=1348612 RepID=A0A397GZL6_9GLOM|nr:hypothetical protein Glove_421g103 [Diversispora epigaea]